MSSILMAIDGSPHSYKVVDEAVALAKEIGAKIILVHVIPRIEVPTEFLEFMKTERIEVSPEYLYSTKVVEEILQRFGERVAGSGVEYDTIVEVGMWLSVL
ncbi:MAG: universal stress protein [Aigarchaeota archaeon]|nr:universal stress protein [Candidatus Pelearchaeum maunauluense]